ncbi:hypothetical protein Tco_0885839 [Tanacetum coccineum]
MILLLTNSRAVIILLSVSRSLVSIVGPGCLAAAAAELSPISHPGLGVLKNDSRLMLHLSSQLECSRLRGVSVELERMVVLEVLTLENVCLRRTNCWAAPRKDLRWNTPKIVLRVNRRIGNADNGRQTT